MIDLPVVVKKPWKMKSQVSLSLKIFDRLITLINQTVHMIPISDFTSISFDLGSVLAWGKSLSKNSSNYLTIFSLK